jgi:hypothetical protein
MSLRKDIVEDLQNIIDELGSPMFTWKGNSYNFIPSITEFNRQLETGGYQLVKLMTATVPAFTYCDENFTPLFSMGLPSPQQVITYALDGNNYRIESTKMDPTNSYFRIVCHSTTKGL